MNSTIKTLLLWAIIFVVVILLWNSFQSGQTDLTDLTYSDFIDRLDDGDIDEITINEQQQRLIGRINPSSVYPDGGEFSTQAPVTDGLVERLEAAEVRITFEEPSQGTIFTMLISWAPLLVLVGLWIFIMRQMQTGGNRAMSFGKSKAKLP